MTISALVLSLALGGATVAAQPAGPAVKWSASSPTSPVRAGGVATITVLADVQPEWHLYALTQPKGGPIPLEIKAAKGQPFEVRAAKISAPAPKAAQDENFKLETRYYDGPTTFSVPVSVAASATDGRQMLSLEVRYQACSDTICLRPMTQTLQVPLVVAAKP
jgi:thiol:disulfide interchange protein DsbD